MRFLIATALVLIMSASASHIDDENGELSGLKWDEIVIRTYKNCNLDLLPEVIFSC